MFQINTILPYLYKNLSRSLPNVPWTRPKLLLWFSFPFFLRNKIWHCSKCLNTKMLKTLILFYKNGNFLFLFISQNWIYFCKLIALNYTTRCMYFANIYVGHFSEISVLGQTTEAISGERTAWMVLSKNSVSFCVLEIECDTYR